MGEIKGILFDFNGTLFFDTEYHFEAFGSFYPRYGLTAPDRDYMINKLFGRSNDDLFPDQFKPDATKEDVDRFTEEKEHMYMEMCYKNPERLHLVEGAAELLDYLKENNIPFCMATGSPLVNVNFYFEALGIGRWFTFDNIVYCDGSFAGKPAPDIYRLAAERIGLDTSECAVFEDGTSGILSANSAGIGKVVALYQEDLPSPITDKTHVDGVCHDLKDWKNILSSIGVI